MTDSKPFEKGKGAWRGAGVRLFAAPKRQPRVRRATDVVFLVPSALALALAIALYPPSTTERALIRFLAALPGWLDPVFAFGYDLLWLWAALVLVAALVRKRFLVLGQALASLVLAAVLGLAAARLALGYWPDALDAVRGADDELRFPNVQLAASAAVVLAVSPHLVTPLRSAGRWLLLLGVVGAAVVGASTPLGTLSAVLIAVVAASIVNLATGTSAGRPGLSDVERGLAQLGVLARDLREVAEQQAGVLRLQALAEDGTPLLVKAYGRDAADSQLVAKLWRRVWYRGEGPSIRWGRIQAAEHEAFLALLVHRAGLPTRDVVTVGETANGEALLVLAGVALPLGSLGREEVEDEHLRGAWRALQLLDELGVAHQQLDPTTVALLDDGVGFLDFGGAVVAPDEDQRGADRAQLFVTTVVLAGADRALAAARDVVGADGVEAILPYLQGAAFTSPLRRAVKEADLDVDDLREEVAGALEVEPPEPVKLRRVTLRSGIQIALLGFASYTILSAAAGVDWGEVRTSVSDASWAWILAAFVVAQLPRLTQAISTLGSVPAPLPFGPVYVMQLATGYMNVALPSNLARMAVNIRFFQRQGLSPPTAVASGAIDSFASTVIQAVLLVLLLIFSESTIALDLPVPSGDPRRLLWILGAAVLVSVLVLVLVPRIRTAITENVRRWWPDVRRTLVALRTSHKLAQLVLGSLGTEILFAVSLGFFARAFGYDLALVELVVIVISVSLLGSLVPVPGNIGVAELGLALGLTGAGMTPETALAAVLLYRISTFYLPPLWGFFALRWLQRNRYL